LGASVASITNYRTTKYLALLKQPGVSSADTDKVSRWIGGNFKRQIKQNLVNAMQSFNEKVTMAAQLAKQIKNIADDDKMRAYDFSHGDNGVRNAKFFKME
jgi:hypothetical protein